MRATLVHRLALLEAANPDQSWKYTKGLASLLEAARRLPPREPWDIPDLDPTAPGLEGLLARAKLGLPEPR